MNLNSVKNIKNVVPKSVSVKTARAGLKVRKHSPEILFGVGVTGMVTSTVLACRATLKIDEVLDDHQSKMDQATELFKTDTPDYTEQDLIKDKAILKVRSAVSIGKLYALPVGIGVASIGCLAGSHTILNKRNVALTAAYASLDKGFSAYRDRVVSELGYDKDQEFRYDTENRKVTQTDDNGTTSQKTVKTVSDNAPSIYARFFDECSKSWSPTSEYNRIFLQCQQNYANDMLLARGHVFLNEVYDMLGMERTKAGAVVGWVLDGGGDNRVDFGIFTGNEPRIRDFVNGRESSILLDFNVDGVIYDKI